MKKLDATKARRIHGGGPGNGNGKGPPCANDGSTTLDHLFGVARMTEHLPGALTNGHSNVAGANGVVSEPHQNC